MANVRKPSPALPQPPQAIGQPARGYLQVLVRSIDSYVTNESAPGELVGATLLLLQPATSGAGAIDGTVWIDANGFLRIVRTSDAFASGLRMRLALGTVTVTTA